MNISVFGLGYVGCVSLGCLYKMGNNVIGVDIAEHKVNLINDGKPTIIETEIDSLISSGVNEKKISATTDVVYSIKETDFSFICVGTPVNAYGEMNLSYIKSISKSIGEGLKGKDSYHVVAVRSTVPPGTCKMVSEILEEVSGKKEGKDFSVISNPEFLREGTAVYDYFNPPVTVIGSKDILAGEIASSLYATLGAPIEMVPTEVAEMIKFVNNSWHAVKIAFANEVGLIAKEMNVDSHLLMDLFAKDTKLNLSKAYTKPGFAYGGSCLPKDLSGLVYLGKMNHLEVPVLASVSGSNNGIKKKAVDKVLSFGRKKVGVLGISFKEGTDDLRYSPYVDVVEELVGKGYDVSIYDANVNYSNLFGINKQFIDVHLPHLVHLLKTNIDDVVQNSEIILVSHKLPEYLEFPKRFPEKVFIELTKNNHGSLIPDNVSGITW